MTLERIEQLTKEYVSTINSNHQAVAKRAYCDGLQKVAELISLLREYKFAREKFNEACSFNGYFSQQNREFAGFEMTKRENAVIDFIKKLEE